MRRRFALVAGIVFTIVFSMHLLRLALRWDVVIDGWHVPAGISWGALAVSGSLACWAFFSSRRG